MQFNLSGAQSTLLVSAPPFSLNFTVSARLRGTFSRDSLQSALQRLRYRHPLTAVRIAPGTNGSPACFTTDDVSPIPLRVIECKGDQDWVREVEREIAQPSNYATGPLLRCVWLRGEEVSDLLLVCDHITADGLAAIYALRDLLELIVDPNLILEPLLPPRLADLVPPAMRKRIDETVSADADAPPTGFPSHPEETTDNPLRVLPFALDEAETSALVSHCRRESVTVQAALCAAWAMTFAQRQPDTPVRCLETPINIRGRLLRPLEEVYGNYISLVYSSVDCSPGLTPWDIARQVGRSLAAATDEQLFTVPLILMAVADQPLRIPIVHFDYDLSISNLGRVDIPAQYGQLCIESIYGPTMNVSHPGHRILGVTTFGGRMCCTFTSRDPQAQQILQQAREITTEMVSNRERTIS
jgi:hypothetical protein